MPTVDPSDKVKRDGERNEALDTFIAALRSGVSHNRCGRRFAWRRNCIHRHTTPRRTAATTSATDDV
jgi:hypothetical protein